MLLEPGIGFLRRSIHSSPNITIERFLVSTLSIAPPNVLLVVIYLVMKAVVDCNLKPSDPVDVAHQLFELFAVSLVNEAAFGIGQK